MVKISVVGFASCLILFSGCKPAPGLRISEELKTPELTKVHEFPAPYPIEKKSAQITPMSFSSAQQRYGIATGAYVNGRLFTVRNTLDQGDTVDFIKTEWLDLITGARQEVKKDLPPSPVSQYNQQPIVHYLPGVEANLWESFFYVHRLKLLTRGQELLLFNQIDGATHYPGILKTPSDDPRSWVILDRSLFSKRRTGEFLVDMSLSELGDFLAGWTTDSSVLFQYGSIDSPKPVVVGQGNILTRQIRTFGNAQEGWGGILFNHDDGLQVHTFYLNKPFVMPEQYLIKKTILIPPAPLKTDGTQSHFVSNGEYLFLSSQKMPSDIRSSIAAGVVGQTAVILWIQLDRDFEAGKPTAERMSLKMARSTTQGKMWGTYTVPLSPPTDNLNLYAFPWKDKLLVLWGTQYFLLDPTTLTLSNPKALPITNPFFVPDLVQGGPQDLLFCWPTVFSIQ